jgi:uncharacterized protein YceH (UPF0502 family)
MPRMETDTATPATPVLNPAQARVLGCLIEKEALTPDVYPLTVNAAQAAANQKTAREPVMALHPGDVQHALRELERMGLARQHFSSRAERYAHRAGEALDLTRQQVALLGLLLLRGPQTVHELLARAERMTRFEDADDVRHHLDRLVRRDMPLVVLLPRGSGRREDRYMHLLGGPVDAGVLQTLPPAPRDGGGEAGADSAPLAQRVQALEHAVAALRERLAALEAACRSAATP